MKYPKWFPYPVCWLKSLALFVYLGFAVRVGLFWGMMGTVAGVKSSALLLIILPFLLLVGIHHIWLGKTK